MAQAFMLQAPIVLTAALLTVSGGGPPAPCTAPLPPDLAAPLPPDLAVPLPPDLRSFRLVPTQVAGGASGTVELRFVDSPFGVTVTRDGAHLYRMTLATTGLPRAGGVPVVWVATPSLDRVRNVGTPGADGSLEAEVGFNKFLVFVTLEPSADVERRSGPILLRGIAPSGRMHTMRGHGPFAGEPCGTGPFGPG